MIDRLLASARRGRSAVLLVRGEAGIGKTALLRHAVGLGSGMCVLSATGVAAESELSFAALSELFLPVLGQIGLLPAPQAAALEGALALGPPAGADRFAVSVATLNLLSLTAGTRPVLLAVDDLQWVDAASAAALVFALRRLNGEPVAALLAIREGESVAVDLSGLPEIELEGLDRDSSLELLAASPKARLAPHVADALVTATEGNPLALIEIPTLLSEEQRSGRAPLGHPLPAGRGIARAYARQLDSLPADARTALLVAAASDTSALEIVLCALRELGVAANALERAESAGLVAIDGLRLEFRHPLLRSSVFAGALPACRRAAHGALAAAYALAGTDDAFERRAWHLSAAALGPDETTAVMLERVGARSAELHAVVAAARAYERAAHLSIDPEAAAERLLHAAAAWQRANHPREAAALLDEAERITREPLRRIRMHHLRAKIDTWRGPAAEAYEQLMADAEALESEAPDKAASMSADAVLCAIVAGDIRLAVACGERAHELARRVGGAAEVIAELQLGKALILSGESRTGHELVLRCVELLDDASPLEHADELSQCAPALMTVEEFALTERVLGHVLDAARAENVVGLVPYCIGAQSELDARLGRWTSAYANGLASVDLAREAAQQGQLSYNLARLARVEAAQGREDACRAHAGEALELAAALRFGSTQPFAHSALGLLELGTGHPAQALGHLEETRRWADDVMGMLEPARIEWMPDLVEAYARCGRTDDAIGLLGELERRAGRSAASWPAAAAARCRGLLAGEGGFEAHLGTALAIHDRAPIPFERARTQLCLGERLRRARRRADARVPLREAWEIFERLGAGPWADRARAELKATGLSVSSRDVRFSDELTPQELQIAQIVATGATNKEAAAALFLTPKTVEFHLAKIYRKLGLRSRTELAHRLSTTPVSR